jgi:antitoxin HicB
MMRGYPARFQPAKEGGFTVTFRDVPEAITEGDTPDDAMAAAVDALESALSFYINDRKPLPKPSALKRSERMVELSAIGMTKTALHEAMLAEKVSRAELARRLSCHLEQVARLLDLTHASKFEQLERALAAVNRKMVVSVEGV